jgi:hypothetical protein
MKPDENPFDGSTEDPGMLISTELADFPDFYVCAVGLEQSAPFVEPELFRLRLMVKRHAGAGDRPLTPQESQRELIEYVRRKGLSLFFGTNGYAVHLEPVRCLWCGIPCGRQLCGNCKTMKQSAACGICGKRYDDDPRQTRKNARRWRMAACPTCGGFVWCCPDCIGKPARKGAEPAGLLEVKKRHVAAGCKSPCPDGSPVMPPEEFGPPGPGWNGRDDDDVVADRPGVVVSVGPSSTKAGAP